MYTAFFGLNENPFAITPDPRYLYMSERHREALAHLIYGAVESGGFVQLTGEVGTGKTTVTRAFLEQLPERVDAALVLNPKLTALELLETIAEELHVTLAPGPHTPKRLIDTLNDYLLGAYARGRRTVVVIDEAQNLSPEVLEQVRLLTNLETDRHKLLQIFLVGQPELRELLARREMRQLAQRVTARYHLEPLDERETGDYIHHRLRVAGGSDSTFPPAAVRAVYTASTGIPRLINVICDRALLGAYAADWRQVSPGIVRVAAREIAGEAVGSDMQTAAVRPWRIALPAAAIGAALAAALLLALRWLPLPDSLFAGGEEPPSTTQTQKDPSFTPIQRTQPEIPLADRTQAEQVLWATWGESLAAGDACLQGDETGLRCYFGVGGMELLRQFDRPALLSMQSGSHSGYGVLVALNGGDATIDFGGERRTLAVSDLLPLLSGEFMLLWRPPPEARLLRPGARGTPVAWLSRALAQVDGGHTVEELDPVMDGRLEARVRAFQRARGLDVDGLVGEQTLLYLTTAANLPPGPRLSAPPPAQ